MAQKISEEKAKRAELLIEVAYRIKQGFASNPEYDKADVLLELQALVGQEPQEVCQCERGGPVCSRHSAQIRADRRQIDRRETR